MRRTMVRGIAMLFAVLVLTQAVSAPAAAAGTVFFTATNETILPLSDATMPFWSDGYLYISSAAFSGGSLGFYYSRNTIKQTVVLYTSNRALIFHLDTGTVMDSQFNSYWPPAVVRGSRVFLPVSTIADYFGLTYTYTRVSHGYLIRLCNAEAVLSDATFVDAARSQLASRYSQYLGTDETSTRPAVVPVPGTSAGKTPEEETAETPGVDGKLIHLCVLADESETAGMIRTLRGQNAAATIFFTEKQIRANGDLVRQAVACGQTVGLTVDALDSRTVADQLEDANAALFRAAAVKTRVCVVRNGGDTPRASARKAGYCPITAEIDRSAAGLRNAAGAESLLRRAAARKGAVTVWLGDGATAAGVRKFLTAAKKGGNGLAGLTELTA